MRDPNETAHEIIEARLEGELSGLHDLLEHAMDDVIARMQRAKSFVRSRQSMGASGIVDVFEEQAAKVPELLERVRAIRVAYFKLLEARNEL